MQWNAGRAHRARHAAPGDLVFYDGLGHVAIYVGRQSGDPRPDARATCVSIASVDMHSAYGYGRLR